MNTNVKKNVARVALTGFAFTGLSLSAFFAPQAGAETNETTSPIATTESTGSSTTSETKDNKETTTEVSKDKDFEDLTIGANEKEEMEYVGEEVPQGSVFSLDVKKEDIPQGWSITIDKETGDINVASPNEVTEESIIKVPVKKTLPDGKTVKMVATITFEEEKDINEPIQTTENKTEDNKVENNSSDKANDPQPENKDAIPAQPSQIAQPLHVGNVAETLAETTKGVLGKHGPHTATGGQVNNIWGWISNIIK